MCCQERLVNNYNEIFSNELGIIKGMRAKINIETNSQSEFMKARRDAPLYEKKYLKQKLIEWKKAAYSVSKSVPYSEWARQVVIDCSKTR